MKNFRVTDIIDSTTIKVSPQWRFSLPDGTELIDDTIKIAGLNFKGDSQWAVRVLQLLLIGKEIKAYAPKVTAGQTALIQSHIFLAGTDVLSYFPKKFRA
jgi:hypothetical protein